MPGPIRLLLPTKLPAYAILVGAQLWACAPASLEADGLARAVLHDNAPEEDEGDDAVYTVFGAFDPLAGAQLPWDEGGAASFYHAEPGEPARADYLVQFHGNVGAVERAHVTAAGGSIGGYLPHHTLVVAASEQNTQALRAHPSVRAVVPMPPLLRVDRSLFALLPGSHGLHAAGPAHLNVEGLAHLVIEVDDPAHWPFVREALRGTSSTLEASALAAAPQYALAARIDAQGLARLARMAEVVAIEPWRARSIFNERAAGLVQSPGKGDKRLHARGLKGEGQVVAVADTGLQQKSCYFQHKDKVIAYQDYTGHKRNRGDLDGHGTHVAGSIAGDGKNKLHNGVAPKARLVVQDCAVGRDMVGLLQDMGPMLQAGLDHNAFIHSNSWGTDISSYTTLDREVDRFVYAHPDLLLVAAAGNKGAMGPYSVLAPASAKNVLAVGAYDGDATRVAWFSSQGPTDDQRIKPAVLAPGVNITSAKNKAGCGTQVLSGTSMAAPLVAGGMALLRQYFMEGRYPDGLAKQGVGFAPSAALLRAVLLAGAEPLPAPAGRPNQPPRPAPDVWQQGFGRVHLERALGLLDDDSALWVLDQNVSLSTGERLDACFDVAAGAALDVALCWTDPPPRQGAAAALVHDLDLVVVDAQGHRTLGNAGLGAALDPTQAPVADDRNVEEIVRLKDLPAGRVCVTVRARATPLAPQNFALALLAPHTGAVTVTQDGRP